MCSAGIDGSGAAAAVIDLDGTEEAETIVPVVAFVSKMVPIMTSQLPTTKTIFKQTAEHKDGKRAELIAKRQAEGKDQAPVRDSAENDFDAASAGASIIRGGGGGGGGGGTGGSDPAKAVERPVVGRPVVGRPAVGRPVVGRPVVGRPTATAPAADSGDTTASGDAAQDAVTAALDSLAISGCGDSSSSGGGCAAAATTAAIEDEDGLDLVPAAPGVQSVVEDAEGIARRHKAMELARRLAAGQSANALPDRTSDGQTRGNDHVMLAYARVFSGTIRPGQEVYAFWVFGSVSYSRFLNVVIVWGLGRGI